MLNNNINSYQYTLLIHQTYNDVMYFYFSTYHLMEIKNTIFLWQKWTKIFLVLISIHSFIVGILLMLLSASAIKYFGFIGYEDNFFRVQGGIFHVVMAMAYMLPVINFSKHHSIMIFIIIAKITATVFLISYYLISAPIITVLLSGISDFAMGIIMLFLYLKIFKFKTL